MKSLVVGASAGLGRAIAEQLARDGHMLFLVASDDRDLAAIAADLMIRYRISVHYAAVDLTKFDPANLRKSVIAAMGAPDCLFYIAGQSDKADRGAIDDGLLQRLITVNYVAPVRLINSFLPELMRNAHGNIVGAGSVAVARARRNNAVYGSAKRGLEFYFATLRHLLAATPCRVQFYRLGYLETGMTFGQKLMFPALAPRRAAVAIVRGLGSDIPARYLPRWWLLIITIILLLPWPIYKKLDV
jgi:short-subunit dehydrogenase